MKKNIVKRGVSLVLSVAMAISMSIVATSSEAKAEKKVVIDKNTATISAGETVKFTTNKATKNNFNLVTVKSNDIHLSVEKKVAKKYVITVKVDEKVTADGTATIKVVFKNKKNKKKVNKNLTVNYKAKVEEENKDTTEETKEKTEEQKGEEVAKKVPYAGPDFDVQLADGTKCKLSDLYTGKPMVVNCWATWCIWCMVEMPGFVEAYDKYSDKVDFVFVDLWEDGTIADAVAAKEALKKETGRELPVVFNYDDSAADALGMTGIPYTFVVGTDGQVKAECPGAYAKPDENGNATYDTDAICRDIEKAF